MCVVCRGNKTHKEERETGNFCTYDRFSADTARTRAARVILGRELGAHRGETERGGTGRPGERRTNGETVCVCVCRCAPCVPKCGDPRAVSMHNAVSYAHMGAGIGDTVGRSTVTRLILVWPSGLSVLPCGLRPPRRPGRVMDELLAGLMGFDLGVIQGAAWPRPHLSCSSQLVGATRWYTRASAMHS